MMRDGDSADEIESVDVVVIRQRRALDLHQHVDRHALRRRRQISQLQQQSGAIFYALSQSDDAAGADFDPSITHFVQRIRALP